MHMGASVSITYKCSLSLLVLQAQLTLLSSALSLSLSQILNPQFPTKLVLHVDR